jgi:hypothetical protein
MNHYRTLLKMHVIPDAPIYFLSEDEKEKYLEVRPFFNKIQLMNILDILAQAELELKTSLSERIYLEIILMKIFRTFRQIPLEDLVERLYALEKKIPLEQESLPSPPSMAKEKTPCSAISIEDKPISEKTPPKKDPPINPVQQEEKPSQEEENKLKKIQTLSRYETFVRFAAKELEGTLTKDKKDG